MTGLLDCTRLLKYETETRLKVKSHAFLKHNVVVNVFLIILSQVFKKKYATTIRSKAVASG